MERYEKEKEEKNEAKENKEEMLMNLAPLNSFMSSKLEKYKRDIKDIRKKQVSNIKQYDQKNDYLRDNVKASADTNDQYKSKAFNPYTTLKVNQYKAKGLELFLPNGEDNFDLYTSEEPQILISDAERIIQTLTQQYADQELVVPIDIIKKGIKEFADENAVKAKKLTLDLLKACGYKSFISDATLSNGIYGVGIVVGPFYKTKRKKVLSDNGYGMFTYKDKEIKVPYFDFVPVFNFFPDLDAKYIDDMEGAFISSVLSSFELEELSKDDRYISEQIKCVLKENPEGNYIKEEWERDIDSTSNQNTSTNIKNKFRVYEYWGVVPAKYLNDVLHGGLDSEDNEDSKSFKDIEVNLSICAGKVIKCNKNLLPSKRRPYHIFNFKHKGGELLGDGIPDILYESQRQLNSATRCLYDNAFASGTPMIEYNSELMSNFHMNRNLGNGKTIIRIGRGEEAMAPVIRTYNTQNNTQQYLGMINKITNDMDQLVSLPGNMFGDWGGEATGLRTSSGMNSLMNGSNTVLKDISKQFDDFNERIISMLLEWIMIFHEDESIKGDYSIYPRVSNALIEKQETYNKLIALMSTMQPEMRELTNWEEIYNELLFSAGLDPDLIKLSPDAIAKNQESAQQQQQEQMAMMQQDKDKQFQLEMAKIQVKQEEVNNKKEQTMALNEKIKQDIINATNRNDLDTLLGINKVNVENAKTEHNDNTLIHNIVSSEANR